ncbi:MAG: arginine--tRNA ligase [Anaerolineales bacterium]
MRQERAARARRIAVEPDPVRWGVGHFDLFLSNGGAGGARGEEGERAPARYLNLYFAPADFTRRVIDSVLEEGEVFGCGEAKGEQVMVEFSNPNTHKAFHVGHLRSAILGDVICRTLECAGYRVVRANYIGDIGLHVIKWLWNYEKYHAGEKPEKDFTRWMGDMYAEATRRLEENPELDAEVREVYTRWDRREPEIVALWEKTRGWSMEGFAELYEILDIRFDRIYSNSEAEQPGNCTRSWISASTGFTPTARPSSRAKRS